MHPTSHQLSEAFVVSTCSILLACGMTIPAWGRTAFVKNIFWQAQLGCMSLLRWNEWRLLPDFKKKKKCDYSEESQERHFSEARGGRKKEWEMVQARKMVGDCAKSVIPSLGSKFSVNLLKVREIVQLNIFFRKLMMELRFSYEVNHMAKHDME